MIFNPGCTHGPCAILNSYHKSSYFYIYKLCNRENELYTMKYEQSWLLKFSASLVGCHLVACLTRKNNEMHLVIKSMRYKGFQKMVYNKYSINYKVINVGPRDFQNYVFTLETQLYIYIKILKKKIAIYWYIELVQEKWFLNFKFFYLIWTWTVIITILIL